MADEKCVRDPRHDCFGLEAAARLEGRIKALEDWQQDSKKFHNSFYDWQREQIARDAKPVVFVVSVHCDLTRRERYQNSTRLHNGQ